MLPNASQITRHSMSWLQPRRGLYDHAKATSHGIGIFRYMLPIDADQRTTMQMGPCTATFDSCHHTAYDTREPYQRPWCEGAEGEIQEHGLMLDLALHIDS